MLIFGLFVLVILTMGWKFRKFSTDPLQMLIGEHFLTEYIWTEGI